MVDIITDNQNNGKATGLGEIGSRLQKRYPDFDVRSYGTNLLSKLLEEFTRVTITKDHSSVTVELADGAEERTDKADKPEKKVRGERGVKADKADQSAGKAEKAASTEQGEEPSSAEDSEAAGKASRRGRSHRGTRRVTPKVAGHLPEGDGQAPAALPESAPEPADAVGAEPAPTALEEPSTDAAHDVRPGRKARAARKARVVETAVGQQEAPAAIAPEEGGSPEAAEPAKAKRTRKKAVPAEAAVPAPDKPRRARRKTPAAAASAAADTPQAYIRQMVQEAGADGIMLSTITDRLRARFKDFKVRDLGYAQMRQYMASTGTYDLEKSGRNFRVHLA